MLILILSICTLPVIYGDTTCDHVLHHTSGTIKSPLFPQSYSNRLNCSWHIAVPHGRKIELTTKTFELESSYNCESDALYIYDGSNEKAKLYSKPYCGKKGPISVSSSGNSLFLRFITDKLDNALGFHLEYHSTKVCDYEFNQNNGTFSSPNFPNNYYENANCTYRIKVSEDQAIVLNFHHFALENAVSKECLDYVSIYDVLSSGPKLLQKMCGVGIPLPLKSSSNHMLVKFHSDSLINNPGFNASFHSIFNFCGNNEFKCNNGRCVHVRLLCNGVTDCADNTDEAFCSCDRFKCRNYRCISHSDVCDGENHCGDWSDEENCDKNAVTTSMTTTLKTTVRKPTTYPSTTTPLITCGYTEFICNNKECIASTERCDGHDDCGDNSDESDCYGQCKNLNGNCQHICDYKRPTGVKCSCYKGFHIDSDGVTCIDINECSSRPCAELCTNTYGSYKCHCPRGYRLHRDRFNCTDFDECSLKSGLCEQRCINKIGSYECACFDGYVFDKEQNKCVDKNECEINNGGCSEKCLNTVGSFKCICNKTGYVLIAGKTVCEEVDECELGTASCSQKCINTDGSYHCICRAGFRLAYDNHNCMDIDECLEGVPGCWGNCINTLGSYYCNCDTGFKSIINNTKCEDVNECHFKNGGCSNLCMNTLGSFICKCHTGYIARDSRSFTCVDKNECDTHPCEEECINTPGSYQCRCKEGYQILNKTKCADVNECLDKYVCQHDCTNTPGSYFCLCPDGFILDSDKRTCITAVNGTGCRRLKINTNRILISNWTNVTDGWAWQASLSVNFLTIKVPLYKCMAVLIHKQFVLTTAHCVKYGNINIGADKLMVSLGSYRYGRSTQEIRAKNIIYHDVLDLALIQLVDEVSTSKYIQPLCLLQADHDVDVSRNQQIVTATWPSLAVAFGRRTLQHIYTIIDDPHLCTWKNKNIFHNKDSICVRFGPQKTFLPMSGSPLVGMLRGTSPLRRKQKWYLTAVLINGDGFPGNRKTFSPLYKHIAYHKASTFVKWIREIIQNINNE